MRAIETRMRRANALLCVVGCSHLWFLSGGHRSSAIAGRSAARPCASVERADSAELWSETSRRLLVTRLGNPLAVDTLPVIRSWESSVQVWIGSHPRESLSVFIASTGQPSHVAVVGLVVDRCLWPGGRRSVGWGLTMNASAKEHWNAAFQGTSHGPVVTSATSAMELAALYLSFSTGAAIRPRFLRDLLRMEFTRHHNFRPDTDIRMAAYQVRDRWEVTGAWHLGREYIFVVDFANSGRVLESSLRAGPQ